MVLILENKDVKLNSLLMLVLVVKLVWILSLFSHFIIKKYYPQYETINDNIEDISHDIFTFLIGILLIYLYNYFNKERVCIEGHIKLYLFSFGILSAIGIIQKNIHKYNSHKV